VSLPVVALWADGSGTTRGNPGGWAYVLLFRNNVGQTIRKEGHGGAIDATNNTMELTAVLKGLEALKRPCRVTVHSDSEYVINAFRLGWVGKWQYRGWKKVANPELFQAIMRVIKPHDVTWVHVKGHSGIKENEDCDKRAKDCRLKIKEAGGDIEILGTLGFAVEGLHAGQQLGLVA
jgi:ribonuclease HI